MVHSHGLKLLCQRPTGVTIFKTFSSSGGRERVFLFIKLAVLLAASDQQFGEYSRKNNPGNPLIRNSDKKPWTMDHGLPTKICNIILLWISAR
jgi:hypothetical protein